MASSSTTIEYISRETIFCDIYLFLKYARDITKIKG